jgi:hypothetical protein
MSHSEQTDRTTPNFQPRLASGRPPGACLTGCVSDVA